MASGDVRRLLSEHEGELTPAGDAAESVTIVVPDMDRADRLAAALRRIAGVEAAYAKPGEELP